MMFEKDELSKAYSEYTKDWTINKVFKDREKGGFAVLYFNPKHRQMVLAYSGIRGSVFSTLFDKNSGTNALISGVIGNDLVDQIEFAYETVKDAIQISKESGTSLSLTGHSIGGWLAELSYYFAFVDFGYGTGIHRKKKLVKFDSPSSYDMIYSHLQSNIINKKTNINFEELHSNITNIVSAPSPINTFGGKIWGYTYRVFPYVEPKGWLEKVEKIPFIGAMLGKKSADLLKGLSLISSSSMEQILSAFNPSTGGLKLGEYVEIFDWPILNYKRGDQSGPGCLAKAISGALSFLPCGTIVGEALGKALAAAIKWAVDGRSIGSLGDLLLDLGNIDQSQYWALYANLDHKNNYAVKEDANMFSLRYEAHYLEKSVSAEDLRRDILTLTRGQTDWYLEKIFNYRQKLKKISQMSASHKKSFLPVVKLANKIEGIESNQHGHTIMVAKRGSQIRDLREGMDIFLNKLDTSENQETAKIVRNILDKLEGMAKKPNQQIKDKIPTARRNDFIQREQTHESLEATLAEFSVVTLAATGGAGKSTFASQYGYEKQDRGYSVYWIKADGKNVATEGFLELDRMLKPIEAQKSTEGQKETEGQKASEEQKVPEDNKGPEEEKKGSKDLKKIRDSIYERLEQEDEYGTVLIILDNVEQFNDIQEWIPKKVPHNIKILLTSRKENLHPKVPTINISPFSIEEANKFVLQSFQNRITVREASDLVYKIANGKMTVLPLTLGIVVSDLRDIFQSDISWSYDIGQYLEEYDILAEKLQRESINTAPGLARVWEKIRGNNSTNHAWELLQHASYLDPDFASIDAFRMIPEFADNFDEKVEFSSDRKNRKMLNAAVSRLTQLGIAEIIDRDEGQGEKVKKKRGLRIHRVLLEDIKNYSSLAEKGIPRKLLMDQLYNIYLNKAYQNAGLANFHFTEFVQ